MKVKRKDIEKQAESNLSVKKGSENVKEGNPVNHSTKHLSNEVVGASLGITKNMGDYESLRVDVWATVEKGNRTFDEAYEELLGILDKKLTEAVESYITD